MPVGTTQVRPAVTRFGGNESQHINLMLIPGSPVGAKFALDSKHVPIGPLT